MKMTLEMLHHLQEKWIKKFVIERYGYEKGTVGYLQVVSKNDSKITKIFCTKEFPNFDCAEEEIYCWLEDPYGYQRDLFSWLRRRLPSEMKVNTDEDYVFIKDERGNTYFTRSKYLSNHSLLTTIKKYVPITFPFVSLIRNQIWNCGDEQVTISLRH